MTESFDEIAADIRTMIRPVLDEAPPDPDAPLGEWPASWQAAVHALMEAHASARCRSWSEDVCNADGPERCACLARAMSDAGVAIAAYRLAQARAVIAGRAARGRTTEEEADR